MPEPLVIAVVGHTNAGKTSLLRTLTRQVDFGEVSERPGTTRHAEALALRLQGQVAARFIDTPGLEDSVALLDFLGRQPGETRTERVRAFLAGPEARAAFEQEAKVLRALLEGADCAMLVIDTRQPVLPKYRAEIEILVACAKPIMPVLNFVRDGASRVADWHQALQEAGLHARAEFDVVAPFVGSERELYTDLASLLPQRRAQLAGMVDALALQARDRQQAAARIVASHLIDVAAMRRALPADDFADELRQKAFVRAFQDDVRGHARHGVAELLALFGFRSGDAELADLPEQAARWEDDLFNPELLKRAGTRLGLGAMIGAGVGVVADVALAGLSLGAASALGATVGGALSGGWRPLWRKAKNRLDGVQELTADDALLLLLAEHLTALAGALARRGHAAQQRLRVGTVVTAPDEPRAPVSQAVLQAVQALAPARGHPQWERGARGARDQDERAELQERVARLLPHEFEEDQAT